MNLRQIIRNQKLSNFNYKLTDFISEADQEKIKTGKKTGDDPHYWYKNTKTGDTISSTDKNAQRQNYVLATKKDVAATQDRDEERLQQQMAKEPMPPGKETDDEDRDEERLQRQMAKEPMPPEKQPEDVDKDAWKSVTVDIPAGERPNPQQIKDLRTQMFRAGPGRSSDYAGRGDQSTPAGNPPSDAKARTTALDLGFPTPKGTTRGPSQITGEMAAPAPGNPGSMMNEVFSVEGCNVAEAFYERFGVAPTVEEMEGILQEQFGNSQLAEDNGGPTGSEYRKKLRIAAQASITKFDRLQNAQTNNPEFGKMIRPPSEFYGAADSIEAQAAMIRDTEVPPNKIYGPDGPIEEITDNPRTREELTDSLISIAKKHHKQDPKGPYAKFANGSKSNPNVDVDAIEAEVGNMIDNNNVKQFAEILAYAGGGGANPSDTATFARSEDGNLMILFHSDKMSTNDQQANSTLAQEARRQEVYLRELIESDPPKLSEEDASKAKAVLDEFSETLKETSEENDSGIVAQTALNFEGKQKAAILKALKANPKRPPTIGSRPAQKVSAEEFLKHFSDPDNIPTKEQGKLFRDIKKNLQEEGHLDPPDPLFSEDEIDSLDASFIGAERTKRVVGAIQDRLTALDELNTKPTDEYPDGIPVGQYIETKNIIDKLHIYAVDDPSSLAYQSGMCATVIGGNVVNREVLRSIFGIESAEELIGKVKVGAAGAPEGDWADEDGVAGPAGVPNSLLQRSRDTFVKVDGQVQYFTVNEDGKVTGTTSNPEDENIQTTGKGKNKKPVKVGVVTGQKSLFYAVDAHGEDCNFASQSARPKEGAGSVLQTAYTFGNCMKEGIEKYGKEKLENESIKYFGDILNELKQNTLGYHWAKAEEDYPVHYFIREINEGSLN